MLAKPNIPVSEMLGNSAAREVAAGLRFARSVGYRRMTLWTQAELMAARGIYASEGFTLVSAESHRDFGPQVTGETWECAL